MRIFLKTCEAGRTIWGFPKTVEQIEFTIEGPRARCTLTMDGQHVLTLTSRNSKIFMEVDGKREELLAVSKTRFVARGSGAQLALDDLQFPDEVMLTQLRR